MKIGIDAKRAYHNRTGLGNYSRDTIQLLATAFPQHEWLLFNPKPKSVAFTPPPAAREKLPYGLWSKRFSSLWRHHGIVQDLIYNKVAVYHGLSAELPQGIEKTPIKSIVTVHDLIFERFPDFYGTIDKNIYRRKTQHAVSQADKVIAISKMTKIDLINFYKIPEEKIEVIYQSCHPIFQTTPQEDERLATKKQRNLPDEFLLSVGSIEDRKNLLTVVKAIANLPEIHLVAVGKSTPYTERIKEYLVEHHMSHRVHLFHDVSLEELHHFYHLAKLFVFPSMVEGFGIPIIEAHFSGLPMVSSKGGCFAEAGGPAAEYIDAENVYQWKEAISALWQQEPLRLAQQQANQQHVRQFESEAVRQVLIAFYGQFGIQ